MGNVLVYMQHVIKRGKWFYFFRRIPVMYARFYDGQRFIKVALKTDSAKVANQRAQLLNSELEKIWSHMAQHGDIDKDTMFDNAVFQSRNNLFTHQSVNEISQKNIGELVSRVLYVGDSPNKGNVEATLGRVEKLPYPISKAINDFFEFERPNLLDKNDHQLSKWKNPRLKAINTFIDVVEDKDVTAIRREDMLDYREWWHRRIVAEGLTANSANKAFSYIKQVLAYVRDDKRLEIDLGRLFDRIRFAEKKVRGVPFKTSY